MPNRDNAGAAIRRTLRGAGLSVHAINAAWPEWWSAGAESSVSATAELRYTLARRLGLSPQSLFEGEPRFVWRDETKFKRVGTADNDELAALSSFGVAVARCALPAAPVPADLPDDALTLRGALLRAANTVDLRGLVTFAWAVGIPVFALKVFPLDQKQMHAMTAHLNGRYVILLGRSYRFAAPATFTIAHEVGHAVLHHVADAAAVIEVTDPLRTTPGDDTEEIAADRFALELLTGSPEPEVVPDATRFSAAQLADAVARAGAENRVDPGVLAMCFAYSSGHWAQAYTALRMLGRELDVAEQVNRLAVEQLDWDALSLESQDYLAKILGVAE